IVPSWTSSTPTRSMRLTRVSRGGVGPATHARVPLGLELRAQAVPRLGDRDSRHDRLEEPEHDELARLVRWDATALEIEQLRLVDRPDRARVRGAAAVGLVDLERRDRHRARRLRQVHAELAQKTVGTDRGLLDDDHPLEIRSRAIEQGALGQQVPGRVAPDVAGVRGEIEQLVVATEHDLDLLDLRSVALQPIVDAAANEPGAELGERPAQGRALADDGIAMLERDRRLRQLLEARDLELRVPTEMDLERTGQERLRRHGAAGQGLVGADQLLQHARLRAVAEDDQRPADHRAARGTRRPPDDDG